MPSRAGQGALCGVEVPPAQLVGDAPVGGHGGAQRVPGQARGGEVPVDGLADDVDEAVAVGHRLDDRVRVAQAGLDTFRGLRAGHGVAGVDVQRAQQPRQPCGEHTVVAPEAA
jgi:hypothetical protein